MCPAWQFLMQILQMQYPSSVILHVVHWYNFCTIPWSPVMVNVHKPESRVQNDNFDNFSTRKTFLCWSNLQNCKRLILYQILNFTAHFRNSSNVSWLVKKWTNIRNSETILHLHKKRLLKFKIQSSRTVILS